jgi:hypothetical protein
VHLKLKRWRASAPQRMGLLTSSPVAKDIGYPELCPDPASLRGRQVPRAPLPGAGVTSAGAASSVASRKVTPSSSLIRAHAPVRALLALPSALASTVGLCRLLPAPAGTRTFPTLSLRIFRWLPGSMSRRYVECTCPFLPRHHRPSPQRDGLATRLYLLSDFRAGAAFATAIIPLCSGPQVGCATQVAPTAVAEATWQL